MCVVNPIPGQEERNSDHLLEAGVAIKCNNSAGTLGWKLEELMRHPEKLEGMRVKGAGVWQTAGGGGDCEGVAGVTRRTPPDCGRG